LISAFNRWKTSESAGRVFVVDPDGTATKEVTGLSWRKEVSAQVFEEAAVDLGRGLAFVSATRRIQAAATGSASAKIIRGR
jgi:putative transposase